MTCCVFHIKCLNSEFLFFLTVTQEVTRRMEQIIADCEQYDEARSRCAELLKAARDKLSTCCSSSEWNAAMILDGLEVNME